MMMETEEDLAGVMPMEDHFKLENIHQNIEISKPKTSRPVTEEDYRTSRSVTEEDIRHICIWMIIIAAILIAIMLVISYFERNNADSTVAGWVAVVSAAIVFGSTGVPMKAPALKALKVDSFVFALYTSIGIFLVSVPLIAYLIVIGEFRFEPWAILGSADIVLIGYLSFMAVQQLGYCKAPAIWGGIGMTVAFLWGAVVFQEPTNNPLMAVSAILLLVVGVYCVGTSQANDNDSNNDSNNDRSNGSNHYIRAHVSDIDDDNSLSHISSNMTSDTAISTNSSDNNNDIESVYTNPLLSVSIQSNLIREVETIKSGSSFDINESILSEVADDDFRNNLEKVIHTDVEDNLLTSDDNRTNSDQDGITMKECCGKNFDVQANDGDYLRGADVDSFDNNSFINHIADCSISRYKDYYSKGFDIENRDMVSVVENTLINNNQKILDIDKASLLEKTGECEDTSEFLNNGQDQEDRNEDRNNEETEINYFYHIKQNFGAHLLCFMVGFLDGTLQVPFKLSNKHKINDILNVFQYIASFGISSILVSPILFVIYCYIINGSKVPSFHVKEAFGPGLSSGVLWAAANFLSVHATFYLGIKIGFPLTQTCILVAAIWGIFYFKEFDVKRSGYMTRFFSGIFMILGGAYSLGASG